jgi:glutaredoxin 3
MGSDEQQMEEAKQFIEKEISQHTIVVFSKTYCGYCRRAKDALTTNFAGRDRTDAAAMVVHELDHLSNGTTIQQALYEMTKSRTVPQVFVNGTFVGGNDATQEKIANGTLSSMLSSSSSSSSLSSSS